jgi:hypothetical protein
LEIYFTGWAHQSAAHAGFQLRAVVTASTRSPPTRSPSGDHAHNRECAGVGHRWSPPLPMPGWPYPTLRGGGVLSPFPSSHAASSTRLRSISLVPATRLAVERYPVQYRRHLSQGTSPPSSIEGVAAPWSSSHWPQCQVGLHL